VTVRSFEPEGRSIAHPGRDANRHRVVIVSKLALVLIWDGGWHKREKYSCNRGAWVSTRA